MEKATFKKDETPYVIFACEGCKQYMYVKITQKGKKCVRCGRSHMVSSILNLGEIVNGMTAAVDKVKAKQDEFGTNELGHAPEFRALGDFKITKKSKLEVQAEIKKIKPDKNQDFSDQFVIMLKEISIMYKKFPTYILEIMADNYRIPSSKLSDLKKQFQEKGTLVLVDDYYYKINL